MKLIQNFNKFLDTECHKLLIHFVCFTNKLDLDVTHLTLFPYVSP
jgi:hypothetical protein